MSTIIKRGEQGRLLHRLVALDLADHMAEAHKIVAEARGRARRILAEARHESQRIKADARQSGHEEGLEEGLAEGRASGQAQAFSEAAERFNSEQADLVASFKAVIESIQRDKQDLLIAANRDLLEFCVALARKVTGCVARLDRQAGVANVEKALRLVGGKTDLTVRIHPLDGETLRRFAAELSGGLAGGSHVALVEDEAINPGGAVVTTGGMEVDARIETQLDQITGLLLGTEAEVQSEKRERACPRRAGEREAESP
ncbi:MAG: FliH/SctL family protein [Planctomycetota bacterium]|jgi:flagellar assembly protein FliH